MQVKALEKVYMNGNVYDRGQEFFVDPDTLAKDGEGKIDFTKHTALQPLSDLPAPEPQEGPDENEGTEGTEGNEGGTDDAPGSGDEDKAQAIKDALETLDPDDDAHWTKAGLPDVNTVEEIMGADVTRKEIEAVAPEFTRPQSE